MGTGRVAPGPAITPEPLMPAAETPYAGHETAAVPARDVAVPVGKAVWGRGAVGAEGDVFSSAMARPARQASAASSARIPLYRR